MPGGAGSEESVQGGRKSQGGTKVMQHRLSAQDFRGGQMGERHSTGQGGCDAVEAKKRWGTMGRWVRLSPALYSLPSWLHHLLSE